MTVIVGTTVLEAEGDVAVDVPDVWGNADTHDAAAVIPTT